MSGRMRSLWASRLVNLRAIDVWAGDNMPNNIVLHIPLVESGPQSAYTSMSSSWSSFSTNDWIHLKNAL